MKVLMITPRVDEEHDVFGFIVTWVNKLAEKVEKLYVISLYKGKANLKRNIELYSLDEKSNKISKLFYFNILMNKIVKNVDVIFCHMFPEFVIIAAPFVKLFKKPLVMWYTHGHVSLKLKLAHFLATIVITASKESFRIESNKVMIIGHGIDINKFRPKLNLNKRKKIILSIGRLSPIKDYETLIKAADILVNKKNMNNIEFTIIGSPAAKSEEKYYNKVLLAVKNFKLENYIKFIESVPHSRIIHYYQTCDIFVSTSNTGSLDKAVLEAMACGRPIVTCNEAYYAIFDEELREKCWFKPKNYKELASKIEYFLQNNDNKIKKKLRGIVIREHSLDKVINKLIKVFNIVIK